MIFSIGNHVLKIVQGEKTQTRRDSDRYEVGKTYSIQPCRTCRGITGGRIRIVQKREEICCELISSEDAKAEGGYTPEEFERLYDKLHPKWLNRFAYTFKFEERKP